MSSRYSRTSCWLVALACSLALGLTAPAQATGPSVLGLEDEARPSGQAAADALAAACVLDYGALGPLVRFAGSGDLFTQIYSLVRLSQCTACPAPQTLDLRTVSFQLRWLAACPGTDVEVSIVRATGDPSCPVPDPTDVLCGPVVFTLSSAASGLVTHTVPLPAGCCITEDAYVSLKFPGPYQAPCYNATLGIGVRSSNQLAASCQQYYTTLVAFPALTDWSPAGDRDALWFSVDADCCIATPTGKTSWGRVKTLYR